MINEQTIICLSLLISLIIILKLFIDSIIDLIKIKKEIKDKENIDSKNKTH